MNKLRFRSGQVDLRKIRVRSETVIEAGDLVWLDNGTAEHHARPASDFGGTELDLFSWLFLGVAHQSSTVGETADISVDLSPFAVYEVDVSEGRYNLGDTLSPAIFGDKFSNQQLRSNAAQYAIARAAEFKREPAHLLRVQFASAFHPASANVHARLGS